MGYKTDEILNSIVWQEQRRILDHSTSNRWWKALYIHMYTNYKGGNIKKMWRLRTLYNPLIPSCFNVSVRQSNGPLNRAVASRTWDWRRTLVKSNGCSKTFDTMPAIYNVKKRLKLLASGWNETSSFNKDVHYRKRSLACYAALSTWGLLLQTSPFSWGLVFVNNAVLF